MSAQIKKKESPAEGWRRVCQKEAAKALGYLRDDDVSPAVHEVRKKVKRLRALVRLARGVLGRKEYQELARVLRVVPKPLAASRDARVTRAVFATLANSEARLFPGVRSRLRTRFEQAERELKAVDAGTVTRLALEKVRAQLENASLKELDWPELRRALERSYRRSRTAYRQAMLQPTAENLHEWRKRVKDLWYQLDFLCPDWPPKTGARVDDLKKLGEELGRDHDLFLLGRFGREECEPGAETARVQRMVEARRKQRGTVIRRLGSRLFEEEPKAFFARVEEDWDTWRRS